MSTGTGTQADPIIAMSADPAQIHADVRASLLAVNRIDDAYWVEKAGTPAQFSNGLWFLGHNAYWEARMDPRNPGSADPALGWLPANARAVSEIPPLSPLPVPAVTPPDPTPQREVLAALTLARLNSIDARLADLENRGAQVFQQTVALAGLLGALHDAQARGYRGKLFGYPITWTPTP
jgi:hypothetical protein